MKIRMFSSLGLLASLACLVLWAGDAPLGKIVPTLGDSQLNGTSLSLDTTVFSGDMVSTKATGLALVQLPQGDQIHVGPTTSLRVSSDGHQIVATLEEGVTIVRSGKAHDVSVNALGLVIRPQGVAAYNVAIKNGVVYVASDEGSVEVLGSNKSMVVPSGKAMKIEIEATSTAQGLSKTTGAHGLTPGEAAVIAIIPGATVGTIGWIRAEQASNDADDALARAADAQATADAACAAIHAISPSVPCP